MAVPTIRSEISVRQLQEQELSAADRIFRWYSEHFWGFLIRCSFRAMQITCTLAGGGHPEDRLPPNAVANLPGRTSLVVE
jgi:hypothetical protein